MNGTTSMATPAIVWEPPAGGAWMLETLHMSGPQPRVFQDLAPGAFKDGFQIAGARYGLPMDYLDLRFVNDHLYVRMRGVGAPEPKLGKTPKAPPAVMLKVLSRLHPAMRKRNKTARRVCEQRLWRSEANRWETSLRAAALQRNRDLQAEAIETYDDAALVDHAVRAADNYRRGIVLHFELTPIHIVAVGRLLVATQAWGIPDGDVLALLRGCSPASRASQIALAPVAAACRKAGRVPDTLADVRAAGPEAAAALDAYLEDHAWRCVTQYTPAGLTLGEMPSVLVNAIRTAETVIDAPADVHTVRERVPVADRARFDELLDDARRCYGVRDDNDALTMMWPAGLLRRAWLEVGRRLVDRGSLTDIAHAFTLGIAELAPALGGKPTDAAARSCRADAARASGPPRRLGGDEGPPPDPSVFPRPLAGMMAALALMFDFDDESEGVGVGDAVYTGRACVAPTPEDALLSLQPGDVLVTATTTPAFEAVMRIAGAVVTENGGPACHAAIVCRELGIPAVVGLAGATTRIPHGATVTVDPAAGRAIV